MLLSVIDDLICPESGVVLRLAAGARVERGEVLDGVLEGGQRPYRIEHGIPRFVAPEVEADPTVRSFADKWRQHDYYRDHTKRFYSAWYLDRYGFVDEQGLGAFVANKPRILDAGTGAGRDAEAFARLAEGSIVYAVDTAFGALETAREQGSHPRIVHLQADIHRLPFADGFFDLVSCDQVIHHTPDPPAAFARLTRKLRPGGTICCYVYRKKARLRELADDALREHISPLPVERALELCEGITRLGRALHQLGATIEIEQDIEVLGIEKGRYDLQRFVHYNLLKCFWNDEFDFFTNNIVNLDWYHPEHAFRYTPEQFRAWFAAGWRIDYFDERPAGTSCRATKL